MDDILFCSYFQYYLQPTTTWLWNLYSCIQVLLVGCTLWPNQTIGSPILQVQAELHFEMKKLEGVEGKNMTRFVKFNLQLSSSTVNVHYSFPHLLFVSSPPHTCSFSNCSKADETIYFLLLSPQPRCAVAMATDATGTKHDMHLEVTESKAPGK